MWLVVQVLGVLVAVAWVSVLLFAAYVIWRGVPGEGQ